MIVHNPPDRLSRLIVVQANNVVVAGNRCSGVMLISELPLLRRERELRKDLIHKINVGSTAQLAESVSRHLRSVLPRSVSVLNPSVASTPAGREQRDGRADNPPSHQLLTARRLSPISAIFALADSSC